MSLISPLADAMSPPESCDVCPVRLSELPTGTVARLHATDVAGEDGALLRALGLTERCRLRLCKSGEPCIVEVRTTRIGLSRAVAEQLLVVPEPAY
jgi:Fe2+ transport system protein FeoA